MPFSSYNTGSGAAPDGPLLPPQFLFFVFLWRDRTAKEEEKPEFTLSDCNNPPVFTFLPILCAVYYCDSQYRWRVMNKLSFRVKAKSYTEVTCFLPGILKRADQQGMCPASRNGPIINGQPSESTWIIYNPPLLWATQSEELHFKQRGRRVRCAFLSMFSRLGFAFRFDFRFKHSQENGWWWQKCGY